MRLRRNLGLLFSIRMNIFEIPVALLDRLQRSRCGAHFAMGVGKGLSWQRRYWAGVTFPGVSKWLRVVTQSYKDKVAPRN